MSPDAEKLWNLSEQYVYLAAKHLGVFHPNWEKTLEAREPKTAEMEHMRAIFLFPTIKKDTQTHIGIIRQMYLQTAEARKKEKAGGETAEYAEAITEGVSAELKAAIKYLSPVQREILKAHYFLDWNDQE